MFSLTISYTRIGFTIGNSIVDGLSDMIRSASDVLSVTDQSLSGVVSVACRKQNQECVGCKNRCKIKRSSDIVYLCFIEYNYEQ